MNPNDLPTLAFCDCCVDGSCAVCHGLAARETPLNPPYSATEADCENCGGTGACPACGGQVAVVAEGAGLKTPILPNDGETWADILPIIPRR